MRQLTVAIDGPAGAGKSTVAQLLAQQLNYTYIDTGAMYRAIAFVVLDTGTDPEDVSKIIEIANSVDIDLTYDNEINRVAVDGRDVTKNIRTPEVSKLVSVVAQIPRVREAMLQLQRQMAQKGGIVMDGRDIGTKVLPNADVKIFLTASIRERAQRRWRELTDKGYTIDLIQLEQDIASRDRMDSEREVSPLVRADDAILIDTTKLSIQQAADTILAICKERA